MANEISARDSVTGVPATTSGIPTTTSGVPAPRAAERAGRAGSPAPSRPRRITSAATLVTTLVAALVAALVGGAVLAAPASAYTLSSRSNVPVLPTIYVVQGAHADIGSAVTGPMWKPYVYQSGPVASRVSPSGSQTVRVTYSVDRWTGSAWVYETGQTSSATIASTATSVKLPALSQYVFGGYYHRVRLSLTWTSAIGAVLGSLSVTMNGTGEYVCSTTQTCTAVSNAVFLR